ncbi:MAG: N-acetylglucosamine-6-phosphate deacetylase [Pseudomonadota bacterium]
MTEGTIIYRGGRIFDGVLLHDDHALCCENGVVTAVAPEDQLKASGKEVDLAGAILAPGYVDLQVNGGDGVMFNDDPSVATLTRIARAHRRLGTAAILPTLITDTPEHTRAAVDAVRDACEAGIDGVAGLHLEGPHLSEAKKGAHDSSLIRPMTDADLEFLIGSAGVVPRLKVTIAPESVSLKQVRALVQAGILLSLGHTDADFATCRDYAAAGVRCVTHLFNAMRQLGSREPGVVGAALDLGGLSTGIIADGLHVHPATMRAALAAKRGPGNIFLVTDAMAPAGTDLDAFELNGRKITRSNGRLTLADGTLAGADLDLTRAVKLAVEQIGLPLDRALQAATSIPAEVAGLEFGRLSPGARTAFVEISPSLDRARPR